MANPDTELDDLSKFESPRETAHKIPVGWSILFWGLIAWGVYYLWTYSPALGGWSQAGALDGTKESAGAPLLATIAFTVIPAAAALGLYLVNRKRKRA